MGTTGSQDVTGGGIPPGGGDYGGIDGVKQKLQTTNPTRLIQAGRTYGEAWEALKDTQEKIFTEAHNLRENWSGETATKAQKALQLIHATTQHLRVKSYQLSTLEYCGREYLQWYVDHIPGAGMFHTGGDDDYANEYMQRLNVRYQEVFNGFPDAIEKNLPDIPPTNDNPVWDPNDLGGPGGPGPMPGPGDMTPPGDPNGPGLPDEPTLPPPGDPNGPLPTPNDPTDPNWPGDPDGPGGPGGPGDPNWPGGPGGGGTDLAGVGDPFGPGGPGGGSGFGAGGPGGGFGPGGGPGGGFGAGGPGSGFGPGGAGGFGGGVPGGVAGMGGRGMMPMSPHGGGQDEQERERSTWLTEDEDVWGGDTDAAPPVIGGS